MTPEIEAFETRIGSIIAEAAEAHRDEIDKAVDRAEKALAKQPGWQAYRKSLVRSAIRHLVYDYRHRENVHQRRDAGEYGPAAKVTRGAASAEVARQKSLYEYFVGGKMLGSTTGEELEALAASESEKAAGYAFNARLCEALAKVVPKQKTVREAVTERKLHALWRRAMG